MLARKIKKERMRREKERREHADRERERVARMDAAMAKAFRKMIDAEAAKQQKSHLAVSTR